MLRIFGRAPFARLASWLAGALALALVTDAQAADLTKVRPLKTITGEDWTGGAALSPDGRLLAGASGNVIYLYDSITRRELHRVPFETGRYVERIAFNPSSTALVVMMDAAGAPRTRPELMALDLASRRWTWRRGGAATEKLESFVLSPDGTRLAVTRGGPLVQSDVPEFDGRRYSYRQDTIELWNAATGEKVFALPGSGSAHNFSPDGRWLAGEDNEKLKLWPLNGGEPRVLRGHASPITEAVFSPDGQTVATASWGGGIKLWDVAAGIERLTLRDLEENPRWRTAHRGHPRRLLFSPDGRLLVSAAGDLRLKLWDASSGALVRAIWDASDPLLVEDGRTLVLGRDRDLAFLDFPLLKERRRLRGHGARPIPLGPTGDGRGFVSRGGGWWDGDGTVKIWNLAQDEALVTLGPIRDAAVSGDGRVIAYTKGDQRVSVQDVWSGRPLSLLDDTRRRDDPRGVAAIGVDRTGRRVAVGAYTVSGVIIEKGVDRTFVREWDVSSGRTLLEQRRSRYDDERILGVERFAFSPDGRVLAGSTAEQSLSPFAASLWNVATGSPVPVRLPKEDFEASVLGFSNSLPGLVLRYRKYDASGNPEPRPWLLWNLREGKSPRALEGGPDARPRAFSPDGGWLVGLEGDFAVVWSATTGRRAARVLARQERLWNLLEGLQGGDDFNPLVALGPGGRVIATTQPCGQTKQCVHLWNRSGSLLARLEDLPSDPRWLSFTADGRYLVGFAGDALTFWGAPDRSPVF